MKQFVKIAMVASLSFALFARASSAASYTFTINLTPGQAQVTTGSGSGSGTAAYDDVSGYFSWDYTYAGVSGAVVDADFHGPGAPGVHGAPVVVPTPAVNPSSGFVQITPTQATNLIKGLWYVDIHTTTVPTGEIRGQLVNDNPPADTTATKAALEKEIKKFTKKLKAAKKVNQTAKAKKYAKKLKQLKAKLRDL